MDQNELRWLLVDISNEKYAELKKVNRADKMGIHLSYRARLADQIKKINGAIESLTSVEVGSDNFANIKKEG